MVEARFDHKFEKILVSDLPSAQKVSDNTVSEA